MQHHGPNWYFTYIFQIQAGGSYLLMIMKLMPWIIYNVSIRRNRKWILIVFCYIFGVIRLLRSVMASGINCLIVRGQGASLKKCTAKYLHTEDDYWIFFMLYLLWFGIGWHQWIIVEYWILGRVLQYNGRGTVLSIRRRRGRGSWQILLIYVVRQMYLIIVTTFVVLRMRIGILSVNVSIVFRTAFLFITFVIIFIRVVIRVGLFLIAFIVIIILVTVIIGIGFFLVAFIIIFIIVTIRICLLLITFIIIIIIVASTVEIFRAFFALLLKIFVGRTVT